MNRYEAMFLLEPNLDEKAMSGLLDQVKEVIAKNEGNVASAQVWADKRKLCYPIKRRQEATYYLVNFSLPAGSIDKLKQAYRLNENILRVLITRPDKGTA